jgi:hypothetical protein
MHARDLLALSRTCANNSMAASCCSSAIRVTTKSCNTYNAPCVRGPAVGLTIKPLPTAAPTAKPTVARTKAPVVVAAVPTAPPTPEVFPPNMKRKVEVGIFEGAHGAPISIGQREAAYGFHFDYLLRFQSVYNLNYAELADVMKYNHKVILNMEFMTSKYCYSELHSEHILLAVFVCEVVYRTCGLSYWQWGIGKRS